MAYDKIFLSCAIIETKRDLLVSRKKHKVLRLTSHCLQINLEA